ncbi:hypothetical protein EV424DRAFT_1540899 [Suillus variegatus]|nr:hypothetical protein EV424DRAFT_1540899 [Suillus variegatus]
MLVNHTTESFATVPDPMLIRQFSHIALQWLAAEGLHVAVSSEQATVLREDVEGPPISRTSQELEAETAKPTLGKLGWSIEN